ncbi:hypothetical protein Hamer_G019942 [Homarus americanus]|uniref:Uncharacterized protein n=1 Tax=Homarus americanus TaxID=6706 RepID=A0A8J5JNZ6_HOMAM|nr:hypothetical protein Hamer_G019942 [Homarus americanus]
MYGHGSKARGQPMMSCPHHATMTPDDHITMKTCMKPHLHSHLEGINNTEVKTEVLDRFDNCFANNVMPVR